VIDEFPGSGNHSVELNFQFSAAVSILGVANEGDSSVQRVCGRVGDREFELTILASSPFTARKSEGLTAPILGWISDCYGRKAPAPAVRVRLEASLPATFATVFPIAGSGSRITPAALDYSLRGLGEMAIAIEDGRRRDTVVLTSGEHETRLGSYGMQGSFFWLREHEGILDRILAVDAGSFHCASNWVITSHRRIAHAYARFEAEGMELERSDCKEKIYVRDMWNREIQCR
jgi:hypothetical protein